MRSTFTKTLAIAGVLAMISILPAQAQTAADKDTAVGILTTGIGEGDIAYLEANVAPDYIQHNPMVADGRQGLIDFVNYLDGSTRLTPVRVLQDGDLVAVHSAAKIGDNDFAFFDVFRFEDGKAVEHWDNIQPVPATTVSGRGMLDGAAELTDLDKTEANKALVLGFVRDIIGGQAPEKVADYLDPSVYMQHNPDIADGLPALITYIETLADKGLPITQFAPKLVVAEGNFVMVASEVIMGGETLAFYDLWRVDAGKIVEHWDIISPIPDEMAHTNGKF